MKTKNKLTPTVYGIGYVGIGKHKTTGIDGKKTKCRTYWGNIMQRCYDDKKQQKMPTYKGCYVSEEWHNFQNFADWYEKNYYEIPGEKMCIDKDILVKNNKIYSADTCIFVPERINQIFIKRQNDRGNCPIGVRERCRKTGAKYEARCNVYKDGKAKNIYLGLYNTKNEAFQVYKEFKETYIKQVADEYKDKIPEKLYNALYDYKIEIDD